MDAAFIWKLSKLGRIGSNRMRFDDDFADRLNYQYSSVLIFLFIGLIGIRQYVGKPIQCWIPQEFTRGWEEYAENYCWVANTYFAMVDKKLPPDVERPNLQLVYYQWAPIELAIQALLFCLPCLVWRLGVLHSGFNLHRVLQLAADASELVPEAAPKAVHVVARYLETCIQRQRMSRLKMREGRRQQTGPVELLPTQMGTVSDPAGLLTETEYKPPASSQSLFSPTTITPGSSLPLERNATDEQGFHTLTLRQTAQPRLNRLRLRVDDQPHPGTNYKPSEGCRAGQPSASTFCPRDKKCRGWSIWNIFCRWCSKKPSAVRQTLGGLDVDYLGRPGCGKDRGNFLMTLYITVKVMYLANAVGQVYFMEQFVGSNCSFYGARVLADLVQGRDWQESGHFPRVTFCDLEAKKLGKNHRYTMQCVLPLNMFLEKIFIFLWFWHIAVILVTLASLVNWLRRLFIGRARLKFIRRYLKVMGILPPKLDARDRMRTHQFVDEYLTADAFFLLLLIGANSGDLLAGDLTSELWYGFLTRSQGKQTPQTARFACASCRHPYCCHIPPCGPASGTYPCYGQSLHRHQQALPRGSSCQRHDERSHYCEAYQSRQMMPPLPLATVPFPSVGASYSSKYYKSEARLFGEKYFPSRSPPRRLSSLLQQLQQQSLPHANLQEHLPACYCCNGNFDEQGLKTEGEGRAPLVQIAEFMEKDSKQNLIIECPENNHENHSEVNSGSNRNSTNGHRHSASEDIV
ncbi:hypothetical protein SprV_0702307000 [Sparganum proliferum]